MRSILITGATGSFGRAFVKRLLGNLSMTEPYYDRIIIYSRDEQKQEEMQRELAPLDCNINSPRCRYFIGDVRDRARLEMAMRDVTTVVHAAALKIIPKCEYDPIEAVKTNIYGAANVIEAAIAQGVGKVIALSTDKAVSPINLYGATKLAAEKLCISANNLSGAAGDGNGTRFAVVRYGNVANSRGSVIPMFKSQVAEDKPITITHPDMTRYWITLDQAVDFVISSTRNMRGGEVFIPKMPSFKIIDLAEAIDTRKCCKIIGIRPGEKLHEDMITEHDHVHDYENYYVILPPWQHDQTSCEPFKYSSLNNPFWLPSDKLKELVA